jgi:hypothetical protein
MHREARMPPYQHSNCGQKHSYGECAVRLHESTRPSACSRLNLNPSEFLEIRRRDLSHLFHDHNLTGQVELGFVRANHDSLSRRSLSRTYFLRRTTRSMFTLLSLCSISVKTLKLCAVFGVVQSLAFRMTLRSMDFFIEGTGRTGTLTTHSQILKCLSDHKV